MFAPKMKVEKEGNGYFYSYLNGGAIELPFKTNFEIFRGIPHLRAIIEKKASFVSNVKFKVEDVESGERDYRHPFNKLLDHPNIFQSWKQMLYMISIYKSVQGFSAVLPGWGISQAPKHLAFLKPIDFEKYELIRHKDRLAINADKESDIIKKYRFDFANNLQMDFKPEEVITFKDTYFSYTENSSRITSLMLPIENIYKALVARGILIESRGGKGIISGGQKDGGVSVPWGATEKTDIQTQLSKYGVGPNKQEIILTNVPLHWQPMVFPTSQLMLFEEIEDDFNTCCDIIGINREVFANETTFANKEEATAATYADTIVPEWEDLFSVFNKKLNMLDTGKRLVPDYDHIRHLAENQNDIVNTEAKKSDMHLKELAAGVIDLGEYRELMEYEARPELEQQAVEDAEIIEEEQKLLSDETTTDKA